jgi:DMSO/TMAO reductase YedYZ molybdopterin-dependent catalytic subunit
MEIRRELPSHPVPAGVEPAARLSLRVEGRVAEPREVSRVDLARLKRADLFGPFSCEEGWQVQGLAWRGVRLSDMIALAHPLPDVQWVRVGSGDYVVPLTLEDAESALLCDELNGQPLAVEHGAPWRLVVPGGSCFTSVKWVDRLELTATAGQQTGRDIARSRLVKGPQPVGADIPA